MKKTIAVWGVLIILAGITAYFLLTEIPVKHAAEGEKPSVMLRSEAAPFVMTNGSRRAVLVLHGYSGTPYDVRELGERLFAAGYDVYGILLPGHGTSETDFNRTRFADWYRSVRENYLFIRLRYEKTFVAGFSMGGTLALKLAEEFSGKPEAPAAMALCSTPVQFNGWMNGHYLLKNGLIYLTGILGRVMPLMPLNEPPDDWNIMPNIYYTNYYAMQALHSFKLGMKDVKRNLKRVKVPLVIQHAHQDRTVSFENAIYIDRSVGSQEKRLIILEITNDQKTSRHIIPKHIEVKETVFQNVVDFFRAF